MATQRFNYNDKFRLNGKKVGISSASPEENLDVASGTLKGVDLQSNSGITTFSTYEGFLNKKTTYTGNVQIDTGVSGSLSGEIVVGAGLTVTVGTAATSGQGDVECLKVFNVFNPPCGGTANRPSAATPGTLYYNKDFRTIEYWDGNFWRQVDNVARTGRAVWTGGNETNVAGGQNDHCPTTDYVQIHTLGNAIDFGTLNQSTAQNSSYGSSIEAFSNGFGQSSTQQDYIQNVKFASGGNFEDFGNLTRVVRMSGSCNSSTRGVTGGGAGPSNVIDYLELQTKGNSLDFGDLLVSRRPNNCTFSSPTRGVFAGGGPSDNIEFIIFASKGNGIDFGGVCTFAGGYKASSSSTTRGIQGGGSLGGGYGPVIESHEIASGGNATRFGDLTIGRLGANGASTQTRAVFGGGGVAPDAANRRNFIDYVTISSSGNAEDFGDLTTKRCMGACTSDSHGGLGGY
jgi:hypothetical protein